MVDKRSQKNWVFQEIERIMTLRFENCSEITGLPLFCLHNLSAFPYFSYKIHSKYPQIALQPIESPNYGLSSIEKLQKVVICERNRPGNPYFESLWLHFDGRWLKTASAR